LKADQKELLRKIRSTSDDRKQVIEMIAKNTELGNAIRSYVLSNSGSSDDATMVFHDSIIDFIKKVFTDHSFELSSTVDSYIFGIAKNKWYGILKSRKFKSDSLDEVLVREGEETIFANINQKEKSAILKNVLQRLSGNCREVLMYWAGGYSMEEIAIILNYKSAGMARKKKCLCMKELVDWLEEHPHLKNELRK